MRSIEKQIPLFPSTLFPDNKDAIDFNSNDIIAFGSGTSVNFAYVSNFGLQQGYSVKVGMNNITSLRFHHHHEIVFFGDSQGNIYMFDYIKRLFVSRPFIIHDNASSVIQMEMYDSHLMVLYKNQTFALFSFSLKPKAKLYTVSCLYKISVPQPTTNFTIDPFSKKKIFFYGKNSNFFMIYGMKKYGNIPKPLTEQLFLNGASQIQNAQFSLHLKDYVFIVSEQNIMLYNVENNVVISLTHYQRTSSSIENIVQFPSDHTKLLCFHKSGAISFFKLRDPFNFFSIAEISHIVQTQTLFSHRLSPIRDDYMACLYSPLGLALLDLTSFRIVSIVPFWCDTTTYFATNGIYYAIGTQKGFVISGHLFNPKEITAFKVSDSPVTFVSLSQTTKNMIYWSTKELIGNIDYGIRKVNIFPEHSLASQKVVGSQTGGLMLKRESSVLGVFIDGKEHYLSASGPIVDFCFNDENSGISSGSFMVLLENGVILFSNYSRNHGIQKPFLKRVLEEFFGIQCINWSGSRFAIGYSSGCILMMQTNTLEFFRIEVRSSPIKRLQYCENDLFGLAEDGFLFVIKNQKIVPCTYNIKDFSVMNSTYISVVDFDSSIYFIRTSDFEALSSFSKAMALPDNNSFAAEFLENNPILSQVPEEEAIPIIYGLKENYELYSYDVPKPFEHSFMHNSSRTSALPIPIPPSPNESKMAFNIKSKIKPDSRRIAFISKYGRDFWLHLTKKYPLRLIQMCAAGDSLLYEKTIAEIFSLLEYKEELQSIIFDANLFAHRIEDADKILSLTKPTSSKFMLNAIMATAMLSFDEELTDEQMARIKPAGISLILNHKSKEGSTLLRIAKLDLVAVDYLIQTKHFNEAMRFVRSALTKKEKKNVCFDLANKYLERNRFEEAMLLYLTAGENHPALYCLYRLKEIDDAYIIKSYLMRMNMLNPIDQSKFISVPNLLPLKKLTQSIDAQFKQLLEKRGMDLSHFKTSKSPRTISTPV